jgi:Tfp pilus assembly protein PilO
MDKLAMTSEKLKGVVEKEENASSLVQDLSNNSEEQNILVKYLPEKKQDEDVITSINSIAGGSGTMIEGIKVEEIKAIDDSQIVYDKHGNALPKIEDPIKSFLVEISLKGGYGNIRQFIFSLASINRLNEMVGLDMKSDDVDPGILNAKLKVKFSYFEKVEKITDVRDDFFAQGKFDMSVADDIRKNATIGIPTIDIGSVGRENLFAL